jgi:hypothetical protein
MTKGKRGGWHLVALLCVLVWMSGAAFGLDRSDSGMPVEHVLGTTSYSVSGSKHVLTLVQIPVGRPSDVQMLNYLVEHREQTSFPNVAFVLTDVDSDHPADRRLVWIYYAFLDEAMRPSPIWTGAVTSGAKPDEAYVVLSQSISWNVSLKVFLVKLASSVGKFPPVLDPGKITQWPKAEAPISRYERKLIDKDISGISGLKATRRGNLLTIIGEREQKSTPTVAFQFAPESGEWKQMAVQAGPQ